MLLTPGEIYFIRETDFTTGELTPFTKIGIVRDREGRGSQKRLDEHQTGNPRPLMLHHVITAHAVERIETMLHHRHSRFRVAGEWFRFTDTELAAAIDVAHQLADEAAASIAVLLAASELEGKFSDGSQIEATDDVRALWVSVTANRHAIGIIDDLQDGIRAHLRDAHDRGDSLEGLGEVRSTEGKYELDKILFADRHPDIVAKFTSLESTVSRRFTITKPGKDDPAPSVPEGTRALVARAEELVGHLTRGDANAADVLDVQLDLREARAEAEWATELAESAIKVSCGLAERVVGVCSWKREEKKVERVDWPAITNLHPDLVKECLTFKQGRTSVALAQGRAKGAGAS